MKHLDQLLNKTKIARVRRARAICGLCGPRWMWNERDFIKSWKNAQSFVWKNKGSTSVKHNGNRTKWTPFRSVIIRVINKIGRPRFTVLEQHKLKYRFQLIMTVRNFRKKKKKTNTFRTNNCGRDNIYRKKFSPIWKFLFFFFQDK